jgi:hypothetical protein
MQPRRVCVCVCRRHGPTAADGSALEVRAWKTGRTARTRQVLRVRRHCGVAVVLAVSNHGTAQEVGPLSCAARHTQACRQQHRCCCASPHCLVLSRQACCAQSRVGYSCVTSSARKRMCSEQRIFVTEAAASWCRPLCACFLPPKFVDEIDESAHSARVCAASLVVFRRQPPTPSPAQADRYRYICTGIQSGCGSWSQSSEHQLPRGGRGRIM